MVNERILECILNIDLRVSNIQDVRAAFRPLNFPAGHPLDGDVMFFGIVKLCTIFDELNILNSLCKEDQYLRNVFYCLQPVLKYLRPYESGCFRVRNTLVAHFQRDKSKNFKPFWQVLSGLKIPRDNGEWDFIYDGLDVVRVLLINRYPGFVEFHKGKQAEALTHIKSFSETFESKQQIHIQTIMVEMNKRMTEKGFLSSNQDFFQIYNSRSQGP